MVQRALWQAGEWGKRVVCATAPTVRNARSPHLIVAINDNEDLARHDAKCQIGFSFSVEHYHSILDLHGLREVGVACRKLLARYDFAGMAALIPDELVDEIAIACTPDAVADRLAQWAPITSHPILFPASVAVPKAHQQETIHHLLARAEQGQIGAGQV